MSEIKNNFPLFPLGLIVMPGEIQPLHIYEPRYKQLIRDIQASDGMFGIPFMTNDRICHFGSCVSLHKVLAVSPTGEMDILVKGESIISIETAEDNLDGKLYGGGTIKVLNEFNVAPSDELMTVFKDYQSQLARINKMDGGQETTVIEPKILDIAGQLPLENDEKYSLLKLSCTSKREEFLISKLRFLHMINVKLEQVGYRFYLN